MFCDVFELIRNMRIDFAFLESMKQRLQILQTIETYILLLRCEKDKPGSLNLLDSGCPFPTDYVTGSLLELLANS